MQVLRSARALLPIGASYAQPLVGKPLHCPFTMCHLLKLALRPSCISVGGLLLFVCANPLSQRYCGRQSIRLVYACAWASDMSSELNP